MPKQTQVVHGYGILPYAKHERLPELIDQHIAEARAKIRHALAGLSSEHPLDSDASTKAPQAREGGDRHGRLSLLCLRHNKLGGLASRSKPPRTLVDTSAYSSERRCGVMCD